MVAEIVRSREDPGESEASGLIAAWVKKSPATFIYEDFSDTSEAASIGVQRQLKAQGVEQLPAEIHRQITELQPGGVINFDRSLGREQAYASIRFSINEWIGGSGYKLSFETSKGVDREVYEDALKKQSLVESVEVGVSWSSLGEADEYFRRVGKEQVGLKDRVVTAVKEQVFSDMSLSFREMCVPGNISDGNFEKIEDWENLLFELMDSLDEPEQQELALEVVRKRFFEETYDLTNFDRDPLPLKFKRYCWKFQSFHQQGRVSHENYIYNIGDAMGELFQKLDKVGQDVLMRRVFGALDYRLREFGYHGHDGVMVCYETILSVDDAVNTDDSRFGVSLIVPKIKGYYDIRGEKTIFDKDRWDLKFSISLNEGVREDDELVKEPMRKMAESLVAMAKSSRL